MANNNIVDRLTTAVELLVSLQNRSANEIYRQINHIPEFSGEPKHLTHFVTIVDSHLRSTQQDQQQNHWNAIFNCKIVGRAKELLLNNMTNDWAAAKLLLVQHFRPLFNLKDITKKINSLKVGSVVELCNKIELLLGDINSFVLYEEDRENLKNMLQFTLVLRIKELVTGNLAITIRAENNLHRIKQILYQYIGFDDNIDHRTPKPFQNPFKPKSPSNERFQNNNSNPIQNSFTNNQKKMFNPSGQVRNSWQKPQPMDVDNIQKVEEANNNIEDQVFLN